MSSQQVETRRPSRLSRLPLERELLDLLGTGRKAHIAARYYGLDGLGGGSLRTVGMEFGLTYERVRQIAMEASKPLCAWQSFASTLDQTIAFVTHRMPARAEEIEAELRSHGLTSGAFRLEGIIKIAELLGRQLPFSITDVRRERVVHARDIQAFAPVVRIARRAIGRWGMASIPDVAAEVRGIESARCERELLAKVLACQKDFHWLDRSAQWFWFSEILNNPVLNRIRKILSVANPIGVADLLAGVARGYRMRGFSPSSRVLLEFCRQAPGLRVHGNMIHAEPEVNPDDVLSLPEKEMAQVLCGHGGVMARSELKSICLGAGMNPSSFVQNISYSPIIYRNETDLYGLRGYCREPAWCIQPGEPRDGSLALASRETALAPH